MLGLAIMSPVLRCPLFCRLKLSGQSGYRVDVLAFQLIFRYEDYENGAVIAEAL